MQQLSGLDGAFLAMETASVFGHVGSVCIIDPTTSSVPVTLERLSELVGSRLPLVPPSRAGSLRPRPAILDRGPRLRPGVPRPRDRGARTGDRYDAGRTRRPLARPAAGPGATAVGDVPHLRAVRGPDGGLPKGAPHGHRRCLRCGHPRHHAGHDTAATRGPGAAEPGCGPPPTCRTRCRCCSRAWTHSAPEQTVPPSAYRGSG